MDANADRNDDVPKRGKVATLVARVLLDQVQLRALLTAVVLGGWYVGFSMPIGDGIDETVRRTARERKRLGLAVEVERLRAQVGQFQGRLPPKTDPNEWVQYVLEGVRRFPVRVVMVDPDGTKDVGPFKAIQIKLEVEGGFHDVDAFLRWVEGNPRLLRVDALRIEPSRGGRGRMSAQMVVLGVMG